MTALEEIRAALEATEIADGGYCPLCPYRGRRHDDDCLIAVALARVSELEAGVWLTRREAAQIREALWPDVTEAEQKAAHALINDRSRGRLAVPNGDGDA